MTGTLQLLIQNPYATAGQATVNGFRNNLSYENPTVEELNRTMSSSRDAAELFFSKADEPVEPAFGTHIREAASTVKKLLGSR